MSVNVLLLADLVGAAMLAGHYAVAWNLLLGGLPSGWLSAYFLVIGERGTRRENAVALRNYARLHLRV